LSDTAAAVTGRPQGAPVIVTARGVLSGSADVFRESYYRQGVTPMKGRGLVMAAIAEAPRLAL